MMPSAATYASVPAAVLASSFAGPALGDSIKCVLSCKINARCSEAPVSLAFEIDRNQFVSAVSPSEPPYRKVTTVQMGDKRFQAEPFLIGDTRGFWADDLDTILVVMPDGGATYSSGMSGETMTGLCEDQQ